MTQHPQTARFRNLAQESEDGWAIGQLCDLLDAQYAQTESALIELADGSKPRTITTVEEMDALPRGAVVACISHVLNLPVTFVFQRGSHNAMGWGWTTPDTEGQIDSAGVFEYIGLNGYPTTFTVLVEPDLGADV